MSVFPRPVCVNFCPSRIPGLPGKRKQRAGGVRRLSQAPSPVSYSFCASSCTDLPSLITVVSFQCCGSGNWGSPRPDNLPRIPQLVLDRAGLWSQDSSAVEALLLTVPFCHLQAKTSVLLLTRSLLHSSNVGPHHSPSVRTGRAGGEVTDRTVSMGRGN